MLEKDKLYKVWTGGNLAATKAVADLLKDRICKNCNFLYNDNDGIASYITFYGCGKHFGWNSSPYTDLQEYYLGAYKDGYLEIGIQKAIEELSKLPHNQPKETITIAGKTFDKREFENAIAGLKEI